MGLFSEDKRVTVMPQLSTADGLEQAKEARGVAAQKRHRATLAFCAEVAIMAGDSEATKLAQRVDIETATTREIAASLDPDEKARVERLMPWAGRMLASSLQEFALSVQITALESGTRGSDA